MISPSPALPILFLINLPPFSQSSSSGCRRSHLARSPPLPRSPPVAACIHPPFAETVFSPSPLDGGGGGEMGNLCMGKEKRGGREAFSPSLPHATIITAVTDRPTDRPTDRVLPIFFFLHPCPTPFWRLGRGRRKRKKGWMEEVGSGPGEGGMIESTFLVPKGEGAIAE